MSDKIHHDPLEFHKVCRDNTFQGPTSGQCPGYAQGNLCILPREYAYDFLVFCQRNPKPCPLLHVLDPGQYLLDGVIDIRTDVPRYRIYVDGEFKEEVFDLKEHWRDDLVTFVIGCSFSFETALQEAGLSIRHIDEGRNVPMYNTNIECKTAGVFSSNMVVSMRPFNKEDAEIARQITSRYPRVHGAPVHIGDPSVIGVKDINHPDFGDSVTIREGEVPVFWACGVTPQAAVMKSKPFFCITHSPGHMLILNETNESLTL